MMSSTSRCWLLGILTKKDVFIYYILYTLYWGTFYVLCYEIFQHLGKSCCVPSAAKVYNYREPKSQPFSRARWDLISEKHCRSSFLILCELCLEWRMLVHLKYIFANQESRSFFAKEAKYLLVLCKTSQGTLSSPLICITNTNMAAAQAQKKH